MFDLTRSTLLVLNISTVILKNYLLFPFQRAVPKTEELLLISPSTPLSSLLSAQHSYQIVELYSCVWDGMHQWD